MVDEVGVEVAVGSQWPGEEDATVELDQVDRVDEMEEQKVVGVDDVNLESMALSYLLEEDSKVPLIE